MNTESLSQLTKKIKSLSTSQVNNSPKTANPKKRLTLSLMRFYQVSLTIKKKAFLLEAF